jgi:hypothetical protein
MAAQRGRFVFLEEDPDGWYCYAAIITPGTLLLGYCGEQVGGATGCGSGAA